MKHIYYLVIQCLFGLTLNAQTEPKLTMSVAHENDKYTNIQINDSGSIILTNAYKDYNTCIWEASTGKMLKKIPGMFSVISDSLIITYVINEKNKLVVNAYSTLNLELLIEFEIVAELQNNYLPGLIFEEKRNELITFYSDSIFIYNLNSGRVKHKIPIRRTVENIAEKNVDLLSRESLRFTNINEGYRYSSDVCNAFNSDKSRFVFYGVTNFNTEYDTKNGVRKDSFFIFDISKLDISEFPFEDNLGDSIPEPSLIQYGKENTIFCIRGNSLEKYTEDGTYVSKITLKEPENFGNESLGLKIAQLFIDRRTNRISLNVIMNELPYYYIINGDKMVLNEANPGFYIPIDTISGVTLKYPVSYIDNLSGFRDEQYTAQLNEYKSHLNENGMFEFTELNSNGIKRLLASDTLAYFSRIFKGNIILELKYCKVLANNSFFIPVYNPQNINHSNKIYDLIFYRDNFIHKSTVPIFNYNSESSLRSYAYNTTVNTKGIELKPIIENFETIENSISFNNGNIALEDEWNSASKFVYQDRFLSIYDGDFFQENNDVYYRPIFFSERDSYENHNILELKIKLGELVREFVIQDSNYTIYNRDPLIIQADSGYIINYLNSIIKINKSLFPTEFYRHKGGGVFFNHISNEERFVYTVSFNKFDNKGEALKNSFVLSKINWMKNIEDWRLEFDNMSNIVIKLLEFNEKLFCYYNSGLVEVRNSLNGLLESTFNIDRNRDFSNMKIPFYLIDNFLLTSEMGDLCVRDANSLELLYKILDLGSDRFFFVDPLGRFDFNCDIDDKLYLVCGAEVIDLAQMKDSLWVPGLVEKIMSGQEILINDKPAPKLSDLNICDLTPVIEPLEQEDKNILKYRITPRNGGLGSTEVYINGNLTYSLSPKQLKKTKEVGKEVYYLSLSTDSLQQYLTGKKNDENPIVVKSKVKGSGIYGRGVVLELEKTEDEEEPQFYGVFVGVNDYGNPQKTANETRYRNLDYAAKDANDLSLAVEKTAANLFKSDAHIYRLTGTGNEAPTKENLQRVLAEIGAKSKASDILYIFFAGHGDIKKGKNEEGQEQDQIRFMLMNADKANPFSTSFGVEELTKWCSPQKIKAQKRVFVFDACHSGKIIDQTMAFNGRGDDEGARIRQLDKLKDKNGMMILAAAADDESAYEDETLNQGVLTYHLLQVMKEQSDTTLVVRNWFDETIELVKDYSKANGNKQEPSSFGDGRFEIGNVNQDVREAIKITCPKTRVGACVFVDPTGEAEILYPGLQEKINKQFSGNSRGDLVFSSNTDKAFRATGTYFLNEGKLLIRYKLLQGSQQIGEPISIPSTTYKNEDEVVQAITNSIVQEIEKLRVQDERCKIGNY